MKKALIPLSVFVILAVVVGFFIINRKINQSPQRVEDNASSQYSSNTHSSAIESISQPNLIEATLTTNLSEWKMAIKGLKKLDSSSDQQWVAEQPNRLVGIPIALTQNTNTVQFKAVLIVITAQSSSGNLIEVDMQSQNMNIEETRQKGLQLCKLFGYEEGEFIAWCDKVGNHWVDAPLYGRGDHYFGFTIIRTYNDEKPWCINLMIMHP